MLKANKGITLVALIITIIVLLILAGVSISMVLGDNGLINKTQNAVNTYDDKAKDENKTLFNIENKFDQYLYNLEHN